MIQVSDLRDWCDEARKSFDSGKLASALKTLDAVMLGETWPPQLAEHPVTAAALMLKAQILQASGLEEPPHSDLAAQALGIASLRLDDDFESVAPIFLGGVRYYVQEKKKSEAERLASILLSGCRAYYGPIHPRYFQLERWAEEAAGITS